LFQLRLHRRIDLDERRPRAFGAFAGEFLCRVHAKFTAEGFHNVIGGLEVRTPSPPSGERVGVNLSPDGGGGISCVLSLLFFSKPDEETILPEARSVKKNNSYKQSLAQRSADDFLFG